MGQAVDLSGRSVRRLKRAEYDRLVEAGCFAGEKLELLYGRLVEMSPQGHAHAYAVMQLNRLLVPALMDQALVRVQSPLAATEDSEPEPDLAVVPLQEYRAHPREALWVIEVAESSLPSDRREKYALYLTMQVPEYWIVNLVDECIEVYRGLDPQVRRYAHSERVGRGGVVHPERFPQLRVPVDQVLPLP